jgi:hypothetical protein
VSYVRYYGRLVRQAGYSIAKGVALPIFRHGAMRFPSSRDGLSDRDACSSLAVRRVVPDRLVGRPNTFVDVWRCHEPWTLVGEVRDVSAKDDLDWVQPRLAPSEVGVFADYYGFPACRGVTRLVDELHMRDHRLVLHNLNGHGLIVKR